MIDLIISHDHQADTDFKNTFKKRIVIFSRKTLKVFLHEVNSIDQKFLEEIEIL